MSAVGEIQTMTQAQSTTAAEILPDAASQLREFQDRVLAALPEFALWSSGLSSFM